MTGDSLTCDQNESVARVDRDLQSRLMAKAHYVDDNLCADCHQEIFNSYRHVAMAKSFYDFDPDNTIEKFENAHYYHEASDNHYEIAIVDGKLKQTRYKEHEDGSKAYQHSVTAQYVVGSGNHVRTYLYRNEIGEMFQLPIVWYSQDQKWGMAPGYDEPTHPDFSRPILRNCMFCHNAYPELPKNGDVFGMPHRFPEQLPQGIGCQRCHGPGSEHVRISSEADLENTNDVNNVLNSIVNSTKLSPELQDDVCNQCHLQPMSRRTSFVRTFKKGDFEYQPGQPLNEYMSFFELDQDKELDNAFDINHHPYRLHQSQCFTKTPGGIRCTHCHDPHKKVAAIDRPRHYRKKCFACHDSLDCLDTERGRAPDANCIECHMPERRTEDVIHVTMTDHRIGRQPKPDMLTATLKEEAIPVDSPIRRFSWNSPTDRKPSSDKLTRLFAQVLDNDETAASRLSAEIQNIQRPLQPARLLLMQKLLEQKKYDDVDRVFESLDDHSAGLSISLTNAGISAMGQQEIDSALQLLNRAVDADPNSPEAWYSLGLANSRSGNSIRAIECWEEAIRLRPNYAKPRLRIGSQFALVDRLDEAKLQLAKALQLDVRNLEAYRKLSSIHWLLGKWNEAIAILNDGLKIESENTELLNRLALLLLDQGNQSARNKQMVLDVTKRLQSLQPENTDNDLLLALAYLENRQPRDCINCLNTVLNDQTRTRKSESGLLLAIAQQMLGAIEPAANNFEAAKKSLVQMADRDRLSRVVLEYANAYFSTPEKNQ